MKVVMRGWKGGKWGFIKCVDGWWGQDNIGGWNLSYNTTYSQEYHFF